jgi:hypothetical protein
VYKIETFCNSNLYPGNGNSFLKYIHKFFKENKNAKCIILVSVSEAIGFYEKNNYKRYKNISLEMYTKLQKYMKYKTKYIQFKKLIKKFK